MGSQGSPGSQRYGRLFARVYDQHWSDFPNRVAPLLRVHYESLPVAARHRSLLDVACGAGHLVKHFLAHGYRATGIDLSEDMLAIARERCALEVESGLAAFARADAARFAVADAFGLAVSTFDALNHLPDLEALGGCFRSVRAALVEDGAFLFDLNTRKGLRDRWNGSRVTDAEELTLFEQTIYDGGERAHARISGYVRGEDGRYERFEESFFDTAFALAEVEEALHEAGFGEAYCASYDDLGAPVADPETLSRAVFVARATP